MNEYNKLCLTCKNECKQYPFATVIECPKYKHNSMYVKNEEVMSLFHELSRSQKQDIRQLVTNLCANYCSHYDICMLLDTVCPMLNIHYHNGKMCKYFKEVLLPSNQTLSVSLNNTKDYLRRCGVCGTGFIYVGRQKYCSAECKLTAKKKSTAKSVRRYRAERKGRQ